MNERIFIFQESSESKIKNKRTRPLKYAIPESKITEIRTQYGSENCFLVVNGLEVNGSFEEFVTLLGTPHYFNS